MWKLSITNCVLCLYTFRIAGICCDEKRRNHCRTCNACKHMRATMNFYLFLFLFYFSAITIVLLLFWTICPDPKEFCECSIQELLTHIFPIVCHITVLLQLLHCTLSLHFSNTLAYIECYSFTYFKLNLSLCGYWSALNYYLSDLKRVIEL